MATFKIVMVTNNYRKAIDMPKDLNLDLFDAVHRADIYAKRNLNATFFVVNNENADIEYETPRGW